MKDAKKKGGDDDDDDDEKEADAEEPSAPEPTPKYFWYPSCSLEPSLAFSRLRWPSLAFAGLL